MMNIKEIGVFVEEKCEDGKHFVRDTSYGISGRELWLAKIRHIKSNMTGESNMGIEYWEVYELVFYINSGNGNGRCMNMPTHYFVLKVEAETWYRTEDFVAKELVCALKDYPILDIKEVVDAFKSRKYYKDADSCEFK